MAANGAGVITLKLFTSESLKNIEESQAETIKSSSQSNIEDAPPPKIPNPNLVDGQPVPQNFLLHFQSGGRQDGDGDGKIGFGAALEEIDPFYENTFIVIGRERSSTTLPTINRFNAQVFGGNSLSPISPARHFATTIFTHWIFRWALVGVILLNFLLLNLSVIKNEQELRISSEIVFLLIYGFELITKLLAKGFSGGQFTCASSFWFWLDLAVIIFGICGLVLRNPFFIAFSGVRLLKIVPLVPSCRRYWNLLSTIFVTLLKRLLPLAAALTFFFTILSIELYQGVLTSKCVMNYTVAHEGDYGTPESRRFFYNSSQNWLREDWKLDSEAVLCGVNAPCPKGYVCVQGFGSNPDDNYTNFDSFSWALLSIIRTVTQDYLEAITFKIAAVLGHLHTIFFFIIFFVISLPFLSFTVAVMAKYFFEYEEDMDSLDGSKKERDSSWYWNKLCFGHKFCWKPSDPTQRSAKSIVSRPIFEIVITTFLVVDLILDLTPGLFSRETQFAMLPFIAGFQLCRILYVIEFALKYTAAGGFAPFIATEGNTLAFAVLPGIILQILFVFLHLTGLMVPQVVGAIGKNWAFFRFLRLAYKWDSLRIVLKIIWNTLLNYWIVFAFLAIYWTSSSYIGQTLFGKAYLADTAVWGATEGEGEFYAATLIPRWNFTDFWHSFCVILRLLCGEWVETLWDCFTATTAATAGPNHPVTAQCYLYYLLAVIFGNFLVVCGAIGIVLTTISALQHYKDNPRQKSNAQLIWRTICRPANGSINSIQLQEYGRRNIQNDATIEASKPDAEQSAEAIEGAGCWAKCRVRVTTMRTTKLYHACSIGLIVLTCLSFIPINRDDETSGRNPKLFKIQTGFAAFFWYWFIFVEVPLKFIQFGFRGFFSDFGNTFDLILALAKVINIIIRLSGSGAFYLLTSLEYCRPFLLVDRLNRLRCVARGLYSQARAVTRFVLAAGFVWVLFAIQGMWMYQGHFASCKTPYEGYEHFRHTQGVRDNDCTRLKNFTWTRSQFTFDNIGESLQSLSLFSFFNGWISIMQDAVDSTQIGHQPIHENNYGRMWFFIVFVIFGVFFLINIIIGIFVHLLEQEEARLQFLSKKQRKHYKEKLEKLKESVAGANESNATLSAPRVPESVQIPEPSWELGKQLHSILTNMIFERVVLGIIVFNALVLSCHSYGQSPIEESVLNYLELVIVIAFSVEMVVKIVVWRRHYFTTLWNVVDFILVLLGIIFTVLRYSEVAAISPSAFFTFRLFRFYRIMNWENSIANPQHLTAEYSKPCTPEKMNIKPLAEPKTLKQVYDFVTNFKFDAIIMLVILCDFFEIHFNLKYMTKVEHVFCLILIPIIYYLELLLKLVAWRQFYFTNIWNVVDFFAVIGITLRRICGLGWGGDCAFVLCDLLLVLESLRIFRVLRFVPIWSYGNWKRPEILLIWHNAKLQTFKRSLLFALPTILNLLWFFLLLVFSFAFIGMVLFPHVKHKAALSSTTNFETFTNAFMTMITISTYSGVDGVYIAIANTDDCSREWTESGGEPNCGSPFYAKLFLVVYMGFTTLIFINIYLALILETINQLSLGESNQQQDSTVEPRSLVIRRSRLYTSDRPIATIEYTTITTKTTTISKSANNEEREMNVREIKKEIISK